MQNWQIDLVDDLLGEDDSEQFDNLCKLSNRLGFDYFSFHHRFPLPLSKRTITLKNNWPAEFQEKYQKRYADLDPIASYCFNNEDSLIWNDAIFDEAREIKEYANLHGICTGWSHPIFDIAGVNSVVSLSRRSPNVSRKEFESNEQKYKWFANLAHYVLSRDIHANLINPEGIELSHKEKEVLIWSADGKTSEEISSILNISANTVNFHLKSSIRKLHSSNRTSAVVRALMYGLLK